MKPALRTELIIREVMEIEQDLRRIIMSEEE